MTLSSAYQQSSQEGARPNDGEAMRTDIEVRAQREEPGINSVNNNIVKDTQTSTSHSGSHEIEIIIGGTPIRT